MTLLILFLKKLFTGLVFDKISTVRKYVVKLSNNNYVLKIIILKMLLILIIITTLYIRNGISYQILSRKYEKLQISIGSTGSGIESRDATINQFLKENLDEDFNLSSNDLLMLRRSIGVSDY